MKVYKIQFFFFLLKLKKKNEIRTVVKRYQIKNIKACYHLLSFSCNDPSVIVWMECGRADHLYWSCFSDSRVNFLLMNVHMHCRQGCLPRDFKLKYLFLQVRIVTTIHNNFNRATTSVGVPSKCLKFQHWTKRKKKKIALTNVKDFQCPWPNLS